MIDKLSMLGLGWRTVGVIYVESDSSIIRESAGKLDPDKYFTTKIHNHD